MKNAQKKQDEIYMEEIADKYMKWIDQMEKEFDIMEKYFDQAEFHEELLTKEIRELEREIWNYEATKK